MLHTFTNSSTNHHHPLGSSLDYSRSLSPFCLPNTLIHCHLHCCLLRISFPLLTMGDVLSLDDQLTFPNPRLPTELLPLQDLCADLIGDSESTPIIISNPLNHDSIPDLHTACVALHGLRHARQALSSPFNTPDVVLPRETWLKFAFALLATVHEGLHNAHLASPNLQPHH